MRNVAIAGALCVAAGAALLDHLFNDPDYTCAAQARVFSDDEMIAVALGDVAREVNLMRRYTAERDETTETPAELDVAQILSLEPDCCDWTRAIEPEWLERVESGRVLDGHAAFRGAMEVELEDQRLLGPHFASIRQIIALDVCGEVIVPR